MVDINTAGLEVAPLSGKQLSLLNAAQAEINETREGDQEIYLLAVTRRD
ncbi:hypothetical protein Desca_2363 [Desulfotomaculum nigrificans CO-1-SRB]|uniref:Uncharacterized protein n=1 Tax=Desulfotomaculum nigrificans (strain DSM 14880 / VKM B-2319 / CO-1-SRB) TaxID=868595 RepID=F6B3N9_DESCC|nr:hypothetical protein [Desulfotomaculum nigrificans]AEF95198.1 hypothetical protein Desca_2363 [Desulfotomaculum nigrificans CO-1-SRB]